MIVRASIEETTQTVERNLLRGMLLVLVVLGLFLFSVRTALIVAVTIPFALLFSFICLDWRHIPANLLSIGAIDFGIIVDGSVVMVENIFRELAERYGQTFNLRDVIRSAAHDVERPIFYAIAVIIAGYLPIYVLTGPSGRLFSPMADTMSFALLGALICALTVLPVLCAFFLRKHVHEPKNMVFEWIRGVYGAMLGWCLRNRLVTVALVLAVFAGSLLLIPYIGGEFMPHLDEGALWVRATTPYTISFEEASKLSPQIRDILASFPQVTTVANELGRPDDGTDSTGFFNNEFYVGLKPYNDPAWSGEIHLKPQLIEAIQKKLAAFPGIIFNYTQPAEDAVDEAETGLKSALAVKIFGPDLNVLEQKAAQVREILAENARYHRNHGGAGIGSTQPHDYSRSRETGPVRIERGRYQHAHRDGHGRPGRHAGDSGRAPVRHGGAHAGAVPKRRKRRQEPAHRHARRPISSIEPVLRYQSR